ncbi:hypothetical protein LIER_26179 [Lithospermum erythrorhizon]|uniref:Uncharacterized protein n=1 Tax=Lithospermum erythrorhizon TaxID=34254 RepID=A0AAV3RDA6_LITER
MNVLEDVNVLLSVIICWFILDTTIEEAYCNFLRESRRKVRFFLMVKKIPLEDTWLLALLVIVIPSVSTYVTNTLSLDEELRIWKSIPFKKVVSRLDRVILKNRGREVLCL